MDIHALYHALRTMVAEAVRAGVAVETAMDAFHEKYFPHQEAVDTNAPNTQPMSASSGAYESLPAEGKAIVDAAGQAAQQS